MCVIFILTDSVEIPFSDIVFQELLHRGTFKTVHRTIVTHAPRGMPGLEVAVKRLRGESWGLACYSCTHICTFLTDEHSELGSQKMMAEVHILKSIQDKASHLSWLCIHTLSLHVSSLSPIGWTTPSCCITGWSDWSERSAMSTARVRATWHC